MRRVICLIVAASVLITAGCTETDKNETSRIILFNNVAESSSVTEISAEESFTTVENETEGIVECTEAESEEPTLESMTEEIATVEDTSEEVVTSTETENDTSVIMSDGSDESTDNHTTTVPPVTMPPQTDPVIETPAEKETTKESEMNTIPETTTVPETTQVPETTTVPETTSVPETTPVPETTTAPEPTTEETTTVPETTEVESTTVEPPTETQKVYHDDYENAKSGVDMINEYRRAAGVPEVKWSDALYAAALIRAKQMYDARSLDHMTDIGGEIHAMATSPGQAVDGWAASAGHYEYMIDSWYKYCAVAFYDNYCLAMFSQYPILFNTRHFNLVIPESEGRFDGNMTLGEYEKLYFSVDYGVLCAISNQTLFGAKIDESGHYAASIKDENDEKVMLTDEELTEIISRYL